MGTMNTKPQAPPNLSNPPTKLRPKPIQPLRQRIYADEKQMRKYNICPRHLTNIKMTRQFAKLILKQKHRIKSLKLEENSTLIKSPLVISTLPKLSSLKIISMELSQRSHFTMKEVRTFSKALSRAKHLKSFNIKAFDSLQKIFNYLTIIMPSVNTLKGLKQVDYSWNSWMTNLLDKRSKKSMEITFPRFSFLKKLENVDLSLAFYQIFSAETLTKLTTPLKDLPNLTDFGFGIDSIENISSQGLALFLETIAKKNLTSLKLRFGGHELSSEHLISVCQNISKISGLNSLSLTFQGINNIGKKALAHLAEPLNSLKNLEHLKIDLSMNRDLTRFDVLKEVVDATLFERITHLYLDFASCALNNDAITMLIEPLCKFKNLKSLFLSLANQRAVSDAALKSVSKVIVQKYQKLNNLHFDPSRTGFTDEGLVLFTTNTSMLKVESLVLRVGANSITDKGLSVLSDYLTKLKQLVRLEMDLCHCEDITNAGANEIISTINLNKQIKQARFNFYGCENVSDDLQKFCKEDTK